MLHEQKAVELSIVCPLYNEQEMVPLFFQEMRAALAQLQCVYEFICVNDGSRDHTLEQLIIAKQQHPDLNITILNFSRNFGKEAALTAGIAHANGQAVIPIDADLQDPPELILSMVAQWRAGYDVVLAKRVDRSSDSALKRITAKLFYKLHNHVSDIEIPDNVGDFRLMSRRVVDAITALPERQRFMKGIFAWVGFKTTTLSYTRNPRPKGKSKFNGWKLWNFALEGFTSFSTFPIRIWLYFGLVISGISLIYSFFIILRTLILGVDVPGYASLLTSVLFLGGIQLIGIGVIGEYVGRIYMETKGRPLYIIENKY